MSQKGDIIDTKRPTIGELSSKLLSQSSEAVTVTDQQREMQQDWEKNVCEAVERGKKEFHGDFFVVVETKKERLMQNVMRNYFIPRKSCPTPNYDQTLYRYSKADDKIEFIWVIPARDICFYMKSHTLEIPPEERGLLNFVFDFDEGTLFKRMKEYNGEVFETPQLDPSAKKGKDE